MYAQVLQEILNTTKKKQEKDDKFHAGMLGEI